MSAGITILVATMSGTAEMVADVLSGRIEDAGFETRIVRMEKAKPGLLPQAGVCLICSSTYGIGEVPDNAKTFYASLATQCPALSSLRYGVVALGDSIYPNTFCFGGKRFDELLSSLGATRIGERFEHDSRSAVYPEDAACAWLQEWLALLRSSLQETPISQRELQV